MPGDLLFNQVAQPSAPAAGKTDVVSESTNRRVTAIDDKGVLQILSPRALMNYLRNAGHWWAQRQAPGTLTTYSNTSGRSFAADGWGITNENASVQFIRADSSGAAETGLTNRFYGTYSKITSSGKIMLSQVLEGTDSCELRGRTVRFQVLLKASTAKTLKIAVIQNNSAATIDTLAATFIAAFGANNVDPTLGTNLAFIAPKAGVTGDNCSAGANAFSCSVTTSWQRFGGVVDIPLTAKNVIVMVWTDTQFAAADSFSITQASLTDGYEIQEWSPMSIQDELDRCQRFYSKSFNLDILPAASVAANAGEFKFPSPVGASTAFAGVGIPFPVRMFKVPTLTLFTPTAAGAVPQNITLGTSCTAAAVTANGEQGFWVNATTPAATAAGNHLAVHWTADAEI